MIITKKFHSEVTPTSYRPTTPYTGKLPTKTVSKGDNNADTKALQTFLNWCIGTKFTTGNFGAKTLQGVKVFQKTYGLDADGIFGAKSLAKAKEIVAEHKPKTVKIGQACKDYDHKAGDSSGKEVTKSNFKYSTSSTSSYNWTYVFRPKDSAKAEKAASMCEKAIANNNIGYSKNGETAYGKDKAMTKLAKAVNYDLSKITTKCGLSCGDLICLCNHYAGLSTCYIGSGLQLANNYKNNSNFTCLPYKKGMALKRGDVLITAHSNGKYNHVAMVL